ncbi:hypothetical protein O0L34_g16402 [Tuta absoluta]|nr:hypothetical protein O0L34_g16402 [Tuta absoluta]
MNNKHTLGKKTTYLASSKQRQMAALEIIATQDYEAFIHAPEDVPFWNQEYDRRIIVKFGSGAMVTFSIMDVVNEPEVSFLAPEERQCRFSEELPENIEAYKYYSYAVCITECRIQAQLKICGCTHPQSPSVYQNRYCDIEGLRCLTKNYYKFHKLKVPGGNENDTGVECDCLPSCMEPDYNVILKKIDEPTKELESRNAIFMLGNRPYQRVTRQVSRTTLDVVVAMGNSYSLFFGGSLLSVAEIVYYLCFRKWKYTKKN